MASPTEISVQNLSRLVGTPDSPWLIDVRVDDDRRSDPRMLPTAHVRSHNEVAGWAHLYRGRRTIVVCQKGRKLSQGTAAFLRSEGVAAETLEGGFEAWRAAGAGLVAVGKLGARDASGRTLWVTRERPKIDRIACPWLIRRFIDRDAVILFVKAGDVEEVADRFAAVPFDVENVVWSHRGELCTFDVMIEELGLQQPALDRLATIVRGADTARLDLAPEAAGLLAVSLGLSRMYRDDLAQLDAGMLLYDALYRWCRDAADETHNWPTPGKPAR